MDWENEFDGFEPEDEETDPLGAGAVSEYENARSYVEDLLAGQTAKGAVLLEGLHEACIGIEESGILVYSYEGLIDVMTEKMGMDFDTAYLWLQEVIIPLRKEGRGFALIHLTGPGGR